MDKASEALTECEVEDLLAKAEVQEKMGKLTMFRRMFATPSLSVHTYNGIYGIYLKMFVYLKIRVCEYVSVSVSVCVCVCVCV